MDFTSVIIVTYRTPHLTVAAVRSAAVVPSVGEVVVVDNASRDGTADVLHDLRDDRIRVIVNDSNRGFGAAANQGAHLARGSTLIFLNSDALITDDASLAIGEEVSARSGRVVAGSRVVDPDGVVQRSAGLLPGPADLSIRSLGLHRLALQASRIGLLGAVIDRSRMGAEYSSALTGTAGAFDTNMVTGACFAIGREAFWELGGFDERFFMYFEDADLCKRAAAAGMPIRYVPSAVVTHIGGASSEGDYRFSPMHARSMRQYLEKWWGLPGAALAILLLWLRLVGHALVLHPGTSKAFAAFRAAVRG